MISTTIKLKDGNVYEIQRGEVETWEICKNPNLTEEEIIIKDAKHHVFYHGYTEDDIVSVESGYKPGGFILHIY